MAEGDLIYIFFKIYLWSIKVEIIIFHDNFLSSENYLFITDHAELSLKHKRISISSMQVLQKNWKRRKVLMQHHKPTQCEDRFRRVLQSRPLWSHHRPLSPVISFWWQLKWFLLDREEELSFGAPMHNVLFVHYVFLPFKKWWAWRTHWKSALLNSDYSENPMQNISATWRVTCLWRWQVWPDPSGLTPSD